jgi:hypothetical protein
MLLCKEQVWSVVNGDITEPAGEEEAHITARGEYEKKQSAAMQWIVFSCADNQLVHLKGCKTGKEAWDTLKELHSQPTLGSRIRVKKAVKPSKTKSEIHVVKPDYGGREGGSGSIGGVSGKYGGAISSGGVYASAEAMDQDDEARVSRGEVICFLCGQPGHIRFHCPKNKRNELLKRQEKESKEREAMERLKERQLTLVFVGAKYCMWDKESTAEIGQLKDGLFRLKVQNDQERCKMMEEETNSEPCIHQ